MASRDFRSLSDSRCRRARELAQRFPSACEVLNFYFAVAQFQSEIFPRTNTFESLPSLLAELVEFVTQHGSAELRTAGANVQPSDFELALSDYLEQRETTSLFSFFPRVVLQPYASNAEFERGDYGENFCPSCGHPPQVAALHAQGHGKTVSLVCSLCMRAWSFRRVCCTNCLEQDETQLEFISADEFDYFQIQTCRTCNTYILIVDCVKQPAAIPFVDELAALPLDVWARNHGFAKVQPNLAGI